MHILYNVLVHNHDTGTVPKDIPPGPTKEEPLVKIIQYGHFRRPLSPATISTKMLVDLVSREKDQIGILRLNVADHVW